jgi:hypothetical protein
MHDQNQAYEAAEGEIGSPALKPRGHVSVLTPQSCVNVLPKPFATQTWSLPSMVILHGPLMLPPPSNDGAGALPSGRGIPR